MADLPDNLKKLCDHYGLEYSRIEIVDGAPRCCDSCSHALDKGLITRVCCSLVGVCWLRISCCCYYERKEDKV